MTFSGLLSHRSYLRHHSDIDSTKWTEYKMHRLTLPLTLGLALSALPTQAMPQFELQVRLPKIPPLPQVACDQDWAGLKQVLEQAPADTPPLVLEGRYSDLGGTLERCNKFEEAMAVYEQGRGLRNGSYSLDTARILVKQQKLSQALDIYRQFHQSNAGILAQQQPGVETPSEQEIDALAHQSLGEVLMVVENVEDAMAEDRSKTIATLKQATQLAPDNGKIWQTLGQAHLKAKQFSSAQKAFRRRIGLQESADLTSEQLNARAYLQMGNFLNATDEKQGIPVLQKAIALDPQLSDAYFVLGHSYTQQRRWNEAIASYTQRLKIVPTDGTSHLLMGNLWVRKGDAEKAFTHYRKFLGPDSSPNTAEAKLDIQTYLWLAKAQKNQNRLEAAVKTYEQLAALNPQDAKVLHERGKVLSQLERWDESIAVFKQAQSLVNSGQSEETNSFKAETISVSLGEALANSGRTQEALQVLRQAQQGAKEDPLISDVKYSLSKVLMQVGQTQEARQVLQTGLQQDHFHLKVTNMNTTPAVELEMLQGQIYSELKRDDMAFKHYQQAVRLEPKFALGYQAAGEALRRQGQYKQAILAFNKAVQLKPHDLSVIQQFYRGRGLALLAQGKLDAAITDLERLIQLGSFDVEVAHGLGKALLQNNKPLAAIEQLETAYDLNPRHPQVLKDLQNAKRRTRTSIWRRRLLSHLGR